MKRLFQATALLLLSVASLRAQTGSPVNQTQGPAPNSNVALYYYNGSNQIQYICMANAQTAQTVYTIGATPALTSVAVTSNVATITFGATAQLWVGQRVTLAGFATTAVNVTTTVSAVSGSTATAAITVADGTYNTSGATLTTSGPVLNATSWVIQVFTYFGGYLATSYYAGGGIAPPLLACSNRASY